MKKLTQSNKKAAGSLFAGVLVLLLSCPSISWSVEAAMRGEWGSRQVQYSERADRIDENGRGILQRDWYEDAYEEYEESPYGYYEEDSFYDDFDLNYWQRDSKEDWYEERFLQYGRGYSDRKR